MDDPMERFRTWWADAMHVADLRHPGAACLSTTRADGAPDARFVDLKAVDAAGFTFCTSLESGKADDIARDPRVALTFWWDPPGRQVRVRGVALQLDEDEARTHWRRRSRNAQLVTTLSHQGTELQDDAGFLEQLAQLDAKQRDVEIPMPTTWGAFRVQPASIEFLAFSDSRMHLRELYLPDAPGTWKRMLLQP